MKAFVINGYRAALHTADVPTPAFGDRDVLVRIAAASINPLASSNSCFPTASR